MEVGDHLTLHLQFIEQATVLWEVVCSYSVKLDLMFFFHFNSVCFPFLHVSFYTIGMHTVEMYWPLGRHAVMNFMV